MNGNERHAIEALFRQFYLGGINCLNLNENEINLLKEINVLENPKKDFNDIIDNLINKVDVNNFIVNGGKNNNEINIKNKKNFENFNSIHLKSQNNFSNEKAENKIEKDLSSINNSQKSNENISNLNKNNNKFRQKSILEILSDSSSNSIYNNNKNYFDDDEDFMDKSESENSNFNNKNKLNKKLKKGSGQYKIQPKKIQKKKK